MSPYAPGIATEPQAALGAMRPDTDHIAKVQHIAQGAMDPQVVDQSALRPCLALAAMTLYIDHIVKEPRTGRPVSGLYVVEWPVREPSAAHSAMKACTARDVTKSPELEADSSGSFRC
jgi:hypothetical protein